MQINLSEETVDIIIESLNTELYALSKVLNGVAGIGYLEEKTKKKIKDVEWTLDTFKALKEGYGC